MIIFLAILFGLLSTLLFVLLIPGISLWWIPLFFFVGIIVLAILLAIILWILPKTVFKKPDLQEPVRRWIIYEICKFVITVCGIKLFVTGKEIIPQGKTLVFVGNHYANWDIIIMMYILKKYKISFVFKEEIDHWPYVGAWGRSIGGMPVYRDNDRKTAEIIVEVGKRVQAGNNYIIFPEGTRSRNGYLADFRHGAVKPAVKAGVDVVVFSLDNTYRVKYKWPRRTSVHVNFIKHIPSTRVSTLTTVSLAEEARTEIMKFQEQNRALHQELVVPEFIKNEKNKKFKKE